MTADAERFRSEAERLALLVEHSYAIVTVVGPDGSVIDINPGTTRLLGYSRDQALAMNAVEIVDPADLAHAMEHFQEYLLGTGPMVPLDLRLRRSDGQWRWFETRVEPLEDGRFVLHAHDITDRRRDRVILEGQSKVLDLYRRGASLADVVMASGEAARDLVGDGRVAVLYKWEAPLVWAPDFPAAWGRELTVGMMAAETLIEGLDVLLASMAEEHGLEHEWSTPIRDRRGQDLGRILVYRETHRPPAAAVQAALDTLAGLIALSGEQALGNRRIEGAAIPLHDHSR